MSWADSLIKLSTYEVEILQKRLATIQERRAAAEEKLIALEEEGQTEATRARADAEHGWYQLGFLEGLRLRKAKVRAEIEEIKAEEVGARDALSQAFEEQKKYEHVAENIRLAKLKALDRLEAAQMDEMGLRKAAVVR